MKFEDKSSDVSKEIQALAGLGVQAAGKHLKRRVKELISIPAPRKRIRSVNGVLYYRATTPAIKGEPPRKLSGTLRRGSPTST